MWRAGARPIVAIATFRTSESAIVKPVLKEMGDTALVVAIGRWRDDALA